MYTYAMSLIDLESFSTHSLDDKLKTLSFIKIAILGNDKEKSKLTQHFDVFKYILLTETDPILLKDAAIIVQSFGYLKKNIDFLIDRNIADILIRSTITYPSVLAEINFKTLLDLCSSSSLSTIDTSKYEENGSKLIDIIYRILNDNKSTSKSLLFNTCVLIPFIKPCKELVKVYKPLMKNLSTLISPILKIVLELNNSPINYNSFENCEVRKTVPEPPSEQYLEVISNELGPMLYALAYLLETIASEIGVSITLPKPLYYTLTSFLNSYNLNIKLGAANVLTQYTRHFLTQNEKEVNYQKIVPALINSISRIKDSNESDYDVNSNCKITKKMYPIYLLSQIAEDDGNINEYMVDINFLEKISSIIAMNYSHDQKFLDEKSLYKISDSLLILSCVGGLKEHYREIVIKYDVSAIVVDSLSRHAEIHKELATGSTPLNSNEELILKLSNRITLSSCYLLRSLSRSASLLRTYLVDLNLAELLLQILKIPENSYQNCSLELQHEEILLKSVVLGVVSNLIVEFSAVAKELKSDELFKILEEFIYHSQYDTLRLSSLLVIRNALFGDDIFFKENFKKAVSLEKIFELCYDPNDRIREQCFNILRNLSVGSFNYASLIVGYFPNSLAAKTHKDATFLDFLLKHASNTSNPEIIIAINYIIVHLAASNVENRSLIMCNSGLLVQLLKFLEPREQEVGQAAPQETLEYTDDQEDEDWKIKLSVVWIIINLAWKEETCNSDSENDDQNEVSELGTSSAAAGGHGNDEMDVDSLDNNSSGSNSNYRKYLSSKHRCRKLIDYGFYDAIRVLNGQCTIADFKERARTAIFHLVLYDTKNQTN